MNEQTITDHGLQWGRTTHNEKVKWVVRSICDSEEDSEMSLNAHGKGEGFVDVYFLDFGVWKELGTIYDPTDASSDPRLRERVQQFLNAQRFRLVDNTEPDVITDWELTGRVQDRRRGHESED